MVVRKSLPRHSQGRRSSSVRHRVYLLTTLGAAVLSRGAAGGATVRVLGPGKLNSVVAYLSCRPARRAPTDELVELLWSRKDAVTGRHDLRQAVWQLRHRLGADAITCSHGDVTLRAHVQVDRDEFLAAVGRGALERAVHVYGGDFLAGYAPADAPGFEQWMQLEAYRLRRTFTRAAESLVRQRIVAGRYIAAEGLARRLRDADPQDERGWVLLLEALLAAGESVRLAVEADLFEHAFPNTGAGDSPGVLVLRRVRRAAARAAAIDPPSAISS